MIRDRIKELRRVPARELLASPRNWRLHPPFQRAALRGVLEEIGYAGALLARETDAGLELIDGHLRAETTPDQIVPVLVLDVSAAEADKLLATFDPIAALAETDRARLDELKHSLDVETPALREMLQRLADGNRQVLERAAPAGLPEMRHEVVVACASETEQRQVFEEMTGKGWRCRLLTF